MTLVKKRDGTLVPFDKKKIISAVNKAFISVIGDVYDDEEKVSQSIANDIEKIISDNTSVEQIQDLVEYCLMESGYCDVARSYIRYRYKKEVAREVKSDFFDAIGEKLAASNVQNQNANVDEYSFGGRIGEASSLMTKQYALENLVSPMAKNNHENNMIYIHDLDAYAVGSHNCLSIPFDDLLEKGFNTRQTDVRPAGSVNTAFQLVAVIFQLQSLQQFGGVSATHLDWTMVPYVRKSFYKHFKDGVHYIEQKIIEYILPDGIESKDVPIDSNFYTKINCPNAYHYAIDMTKKEVHQAVEGMYHNLNTLQSRSGNQLKYVAGK